MINHETMLQFLKKFSKQLDSSLKPFKLFEDAFKGLKLFFLILNSAPCIILAKPRALSFKLLAREVAIKSFIFAGDLTCS